MFTISSIGQQHEVERRPRLRVVRALAVSAVLVLAAARCSSDDLTSPVLRDDPPSASVGVGETLAAVRWNHFSQTLIGTNRPSQNAAWRIMAYVTLSQHASVEIVARVRDVTRARMRGAVAGGSAPVLIYAFPTDSALIESQVRAEEAMLPEAQREAFRRAETVGRAIAARLVVRARDDGFNAPWTGTVPVGPGKWSSLAVPPTPPFLPLGGQIRPFFMQSGSQFRPDAPPEFDSPEFRASLGEVRRFWETRTPQQDSIAKYWAVPTGGLIVGNWNTAAVELITRARVGERAATHVLALMNTAGQDALIACHDAKYTFWLIRPSGADTAIRTSVGVPNHPSYPSNHACISGTSAAILGNFFPDDRERLKVRANEASISRLYGGLHYRFDADAGLRIAAKVSRLALEAAHRGRLTEMVEP
jgi:PAP2 superfamily